MKVLFNFLVHTLCLSVCLRMICGGGVCFYPDKLVKILHELCNKLCTTITDNFSGEAVFAPDIVLIVFSSFDGSEFCGCCN